MRKLFAQIVLMAVVSGAWAVSASAQTKAEGSWRSLAASMREGAFSTIFSARKPSREAALEALDADCKGDGKICTIVEMFNVGCRYVTVGGRQLASKSWAPVYLVGSSPEEATQACKDLGLECVHTPRGGCAD